MARCQAKSPAVVLGLRLPRGDCCGNDRAVDRIVRLLGKPTIRLLIKDLLLKFMVETPQKTPRSPQVKVEGMRFSVEAR